MSNYICDTENSFKEVCEVIKFINEYPDPVGNTKWIIITDLSEEELFNQFDTELKTYIPFVILTKKQNEPIVKYHSNDKRHERNLVDLGSNYSMDHILHLPLHQTIPIQSLLCCLMLSFQVFYYYIIFSLQYHSLIHRPF